MVDSKIVERIIDLANHVSEAHERLPHSEEAMSDFLASFEEPSTPEEATYRHAKRALLESLEVLSEDELLDVRAIMYLGRGCFEFTPPQHLPEEFDEEEYIEAEGIEIHTGMQLFQIERSHLLGIDRRIHVHSIFEKYIVLDRYLRKGMYLLGVSRVVG